MSKIVFVTPASDARRSFTYHLGNYLYGHTNPITGPLILGKILKNAGHEVEVHEELYRNIDLGCCDGADVVCLSTMTSNAPRAYAIADSLRSKGCRVIIGGIHATVMAEEALEHADQVVVGEGETVIRDIVEGANLDRIVRAPYLENLDEAPFPDYSLLKTPYKAANVMTMRGCSFNCVFCSSSRMFRPHRERSVDSVIEELRTYKSAGFRYMNFADDNFTGNKRRAKTILRRMIDEDLVFKETFFFGRTDMAKDEELLELIQKANLSRVLVGIESVNQETLDAIDKHQTIEDIERCGEALARHRIRVIASLVLGMDTDSRYDIRRGVDLAKRIKAYQLQPAVLTPYPGTPIYEQYEREHRFLDKRWQFYDMMNVTYLPKNMTPWQLQKEFLRSLRRFYSFFSSFEIMATFGFRFGLRRLLIFFFSRLAISGVYLLAWLGGDSQYRKLRLMDTKTGR